MDLESNVHESLRSVKLKGVLSERSIDPLLPIEPPRRHITRLEIYSDALFSIIATINILPIMEALKEQPLPDSTEILSGFVGYFVNFSITCLIYRLHFERFNRAKKVTAFLITMNTILIVDTFFPNFFFLHIFNFVYFFLPLQFFLGLLPFASNLIYHALDLTLPYVFHAILVLILWIIGSFMTIYINIFSDDDLRFTMAYVRVLRDSQHLGNHLLALFMHFIVILMGVSIVIILAFFVPQDALYGYIFIILAEYLLIWLLRKVDRTEFFDGKKLSKKTNKIMRTVTTKSCHRERCCAFSDGIFAISITLVAVNLRVPEIGEEDLEQLYSELLSMWPQYVSYAFSFIIIGIWWYWHYKMFHLVEWITPGLNLANFSFLNLIGLFPGI